MTVVDALNYYLCANGLLVVASVLVALLRGQWMARCGMSQKGRLHIANATVLLAALMPIAFVFIAHEPFMPAVQVWAAPSMDALSALEPGAAVVEAAGFSVYSLPFRGVVLSAMALLILGALFTLCRVIGDAVAASRIVGRAQRIRIQGRLWILSSDDVCVPFSLWVPGRCYVVVPASLTIHPSQFRIALSHEAQHHRQVDTKILYLYQACKAAFFWNPAVHLLERWLRELQELACDEAVLARGDIARDEYCRCLVEMATATASCLRPALRASMAGGTNPTLLRARILAALQPPPRRTGRPATGAVAVMAAAVMGVAASVGASPIIDRRVSLDAARRMAEAAQRNSPISISVNQDVLLQLNALLATPDGRVFLAGGLQRMQRYEALIAGELAANTLPRALLAIPLIESGYQNLLPRGDSTHGAGIWMFIGHTARKFGLTVDAELDERLDVRAQTKAAMRLFSTLHAEFDDWGLAILGYNMGGARVVEAIDEVGSADPWKIIAAGEASDPRYLPRLMAAILVIHGDTADGRRLH